MVQWLRLGASTAGGAGSIPGWGTKIPHAALQKKKKRRRVDEILDREDPKTVVSFLDLCSVSRSDVRRPRRGRMQYSLNSRLRPLAEILWALCEPHSQPRV